MYTAFMNGNMVPIPPSVYPTTRNHQDLVDQLSVELRIKRCIVNTKSLISALHRREFLLTRRQEWTHRAILLPLSCPGGIRAAGNIMDLHGAVYRFRRNNRGRRWRYLVIGRRLPSSAWLDLP